MCGTEGEYSFKEIIEKDMEALGMNIQGVLIGLCTFLIIGLFARFNYSIPEISFYYYIAGYVAIFAGAVLWWQFVTFSVNKLRAHFNLRSMWLINKIIGGIILIFAIVGIVTGITNLVG